MDRMTFWKQAFALAVAWLAGQPAWAQSPSQVQTWQVTTQVDISKKERLDNAEERQWRLKAQASFFITSMTQGAGTHFQWMTSDPRMPMGNGAPAAKGTIDLVYSLQRKGQNAHDQGGVLECALKGEIAYAGMILAMPGGQPVGGAKPLLPGDFACRGSGDYSGQDREGLSEIPLACGEQLPLKYSNGNLSQSADCELDGFKVAYRFTATPAPIKNR